ncbi:MAG TPA: UvrD-helicase domain-containing protein [Geobacteraceae bacterium]|nr:UvrD-helicase domain-containing protein [Geobacteraceae bacterium]
MPDLHTLNPQQLAAVKQTEGAMLVLAGAGSGKTRVITFRIAHLIKTKKILPENILAVTFTNKAANEMKERVRGLVGRELAEGVTISTFHSLCVRVLRREIQLLGYKRNFSIYSSSDQLGLVRQILRELSVDGKKIDAESIIWKISAAKNKLIGPGDYTPKRGDELDLVAAEVYPRYQSALKAYNALDFDDLIMLAIELFHSRPEVLDWWRERFRYIMVDEYQDTNAAQYLLVKLLAGKYRNLCVVGDDDQSIYGWRGADVGNILDFEKDYQGCRVVKLEQNYRSTGNILQAANTVIKNNVKRKEKTLWTGSGAGRLIDLVVAGNEEEEAVAVVEKIQLENFRNKLSYGDFAILYRANAQSRAFEEQLRYEGIPYVLIGGMEFYERKEVKDAISYLKALSNPLDEVALLRIVNFPRRGIGDGTVVRINQWSMERGCSLFEAFGRAAEIPGIPVATMAEVLKFHGLMTEAKQRLAKKGRLAEKIADLFRSLGIEEELRRTMDDPAAARRKVENVEQIINAAAAFEDKSADPTLAGFLEKVSLLDDENFPGKGKKEPGSDAVVLMSLHSSKGLEFPHVFLVGMEEGLLPHGKSINEDFSIDEERRLCYVGITRARKHLTITRCLQRKKYGKFQECSPSRFLEELPEHLLNQQKGELAGEATKEEAEILAGNFFARMQSMLGE